MRLRQCFANIDWQCIINQPIGEEKLQVYSNLIETGMSNIIPESSMKPNLRMRPWLASTTAAARLLFQQIRSVYQFCRNTVNKERKWRKDNYGFAFFCVCLQTVMGEHMAMELHLFLLYMALWLLQSETVIFATQKNSPGSPSKTCSILCW